MNTLKVSIKIICIFSIAILASFMPDYFHSFFGDWKCSGSGNYIVCENNYASHWEGCDYFGKHIPQYH